MNILNSVRTKFSGQPKVEFGLGQRSPLTKQVSRAIKEHMNELYKTDMSKYTFERRSSDYPHSRSDLVIYDNNEKAILHGREGNDGSISIWRD